MKTYTDLNNAIKLIQSVADAGNWEDCQSLINYIKANEDDIAEHFELEPGERGEQCLNDFVNAEEPRIKFLEKDTPATLTQVFDVQTKKCVSQKLTLDGNDIQYWDAQTGDPVSIEDDFYETPKIN